MNHNPPCGKKSEDNHEIYYGPRLLVTHPHHHSRTGEVDHCRLLKTVALNTTAEFIYEQQQSLSTTTSSRPDHLRFSQASSSVNLPYLTPRQSAAMPSAQYFFIERLNEEDNELLAKKLGAAPPMCARSRSRWQLPRANLSLDQAHAFLQEKLSRKPNRLERRSIARLKSRYNTWQDEHQIFDICGQLDKLLFGGILGNNVDYAGISSEHDQGLTIPFQRRGFFYIIIALNKDLLSNLRCDGISVRKRYAELWGTLIHEMLHAYLDLATINGDDDVFEQCKCGSHTDHGPKWNATIAKLAARLSIGIEVDDMTNSIELCHEPINDIDITEYTGVLRATGRRYSQSEAKVVTRNTMTKAERTQYKQMAAKPQQKAGMTESKTKGEIRRRRETFPGRMRTEPDGTTRLDYTGETSGIVSTMPQWP